MNPPSIDTARPGAVLTDTATGKKVDVGPFWLETAIGERAALVALTAVTSEVSRLMLGSTSLLEVFRTLAVRSGTRGWIDDEVSLRPLSDLDQRAPIEADWDDRYAAEPAEDVDVHRLGVSLDVDRFADKLGALDDSPAGSP